MNPPVFDDMGKAGYGHEKKQQKISGHAVHRLKIHPREGKKCRERIGGGIVAETKMEKREAFYNAVFLNPPDELGMIKGGIVVHISAGRSKRK